MMCRACVTASVALSLAAPLTAQSSPAPGVLLSASFVRLRGETPSGTRTSEGAIFGGEASIMWHRLSLRGSYAQGPIDDSGLTGVPRELSQAEATIGIRPLPQFEIGTGLRSRAHVIDDSTQRWTAWQLHALYELPLIELSGIEIRAWAEGRGALRGETSVAESFGSWRGGAAAFVIRPYGAFEVRLRYDLDRVRLAGPRDETVEAFTFAVGLKRQY
jgi:hypothetical protein